MKREVVVVAVLIGIIIVEYFVKSTLEISLYTNSIQLSNMEEQTALIQRENNILRAELLSKTSYHYIYDEAKKRGFVPAVYYYPSYGKE